MGLRRQCRCQRGHFHTCLAVFPKAAQAERFHSKRKVLGLGVILGTAARIFGTRVARRAQYCSTRAHDGTVPLLIRDKLGEAAVNSFWAESKVEDNVCTLHVPVTSR
jgi:hypothetical protein